ncbi:MAG: PDZ domain-containing protein [bacterium]|nr:PDZ domain-containing protein [bacterium]
MNRSTLGCSALILAMLAGAPAALAQNSTDKQPLQGGFDKPLKSKSAHRSGNSKTVMSMTEDDGENKYHVRIDGEDLSAEVNGEKVPAERIKRDDGKVIILGEHGETLKEFAIGNVVEGFEIPTPHPDAQVRVRRYGGSNAMPPGMNAIPMEGQALAWGGAEPPKVMLGITMSSDEDGGVTVDSVVEGLPAEAAGILEGDRLISIDGTDIDDATSIREALAEKKPGDEVKIELVRGGETKTIAVKLTKFEQSKLGGSWARTQPPATAWRMEQHNPFGGARQELEKTLRRLQEDPSLKDAFKSDEARQEISRSLERAIASMEEAQHAMGDGIASLLEERMVPGQQQEMLFDRSTPGMVFRVPATPDAPRAMSSDTDARLEKLMKKLEKLDARLDDLEKKIDGKN